MTLTRKQLWKMNEWTNLLEMYREREWIKLVSHVHVLRRLSSDSRHFWFPCLTKLYIEFYKNTAHWFNPSNFQIQLFILFLLVFKGLISTETHFKTLSLRLIGQGRVWMLAMISFWYWIFWNISSGSLLSTRSVFLSSSEELVDSCLHPKFYPTEENKLKSTHFLCAVFALKSLA